MKFVKKYEEIIKRMNRVVLFQDSNLTIIEIIEGVNKDKISFRIYGDDGLWEGYSMIAGCVKILDTDYINNSDIRKIEINGEKFRAVQDRTITDVFIEFLIDMGFDKKSATDSNRLINKNAQHWNSNYDNNIFAKKIRKLTKNARNLGDIFDGLKKIREEFYVFEKEDYEKWKLENTMKKFNL